MKPYIRTEEKKVYPAACLKDYPEVLARVMEKFGDWNVSHDWWEFTYDDFENLTRDLFWCKATISSFGLGRSRGVSVYRVDFDILDILDIPNNPKTKNYPDFWEEIKGYWEDRPEEIRQFKRLAKLAENGLVEAEIELRPWHGYGEGTSMGVSAQSLEDYNCEKRYDNINHWLYEMCDWAEEVCNELVNYYEMRLQNEYEYLMSEEAVLESLHTNDMEFYEDGSMA